MDYPCGVERSRACVDGRHDGLFHFAGKVLQRPCFKKKIYDPLVDGAGGFTRYLRFYTYVTTTFAVADIYSVCDLYVDIQL